MQEKKTRKHTYKLETTRTHKSHKAYNESADLMKQGKGILKLFRECEENKLRTAESKNRLESLMYSIPEIAEDVEFTKYGTPQEMEALKQAAKDLDDWFFEDESLTADWKMFNDKYKGLKKMIDAFKFRRSEHENRDDLLSMFYARINQSSNNIGEMPTTRPWIAQEKIDEAINNLDEMKLWMENKAAEQRDLEIFEDPILLTSVLKEKTDKVKHEYER